MHRRLALGLVMVLLAGCGGQEAAVEDEPTTTTSAPATLPEPTVTTTVAPTTSTTAPLSTSTTIRWKRFDLTYAPPDGLFVNATDSWPWITGTVSPEAAVTVDGRPAEIAGGDERRLAWVLEDRPSEDASSRLDLDLAPGPNRLEIAAAFEDGTTMYRNRTIVYDPTLRAAAGWIVDIDSADRAMTIAFAEALPLTDDDGGGGFGPVKAVRTLEVAPDAAFIPMTPDIGLPPDRALTFDGFIALVERAMTDTGCRSDGRTEQRIATEGTGTPYVPCIYAVGPTEGQGVTAPRDAEHPNVGFEILLTADDRVQQLFQIWEP